MRGVFPGTLRARWPTRAARRRGPRGPARRRGTEPRAQQGGGRKLRLPAGKYAARLECPGLALAQARAKAAAPAVKPGALVNLTDPDSRLVKITDGWVQGYNAQAVVNGVEVLRWA